MSDLAGSRAGSPTGSKGKGPDMATRGSAANYASTSGQRTTPIASTSGQHQGKSPTSSMF